VTYLDASTLERTGICLPLVAQQVETCGKTLPLRDDRVGAKRLSEKRIREATRPGSLCSSPDDFRAKYFCPAYARLPPPWRAIGHFGPRGAALLDPALCDDSPKVWNRASTRAVSLNYASSRKSADINKEEKLGLFSRDIKTMDDLFLHTLRDIYYAEKKIVKSLPEMVEQATDAGLKRGFQEHLKQTENHVKRLDQVFEKLGEEPKGVDCPAIDGIIDEAGDVSGEVDDKFVLDAALIAAAQAVEHYEMTRYGTLIAWAKQLGRNDCVSLLQQTLDEEKETDKKLTAMAESGVNRRAA
jgi:ferritin-like metal-binding protein YciE